MIITQKISPNQSERTKAIDMIVIHATVSKDTTSAVDWMCDPASKVSAHYCIGKDGEITQLVDVNKKAWHAGPSFWMGQGDLNENSIGIELVNLNDGHDSYSAPQMEALAELISDLMKKFPAIPYERIIGHDQIAPGRKTDPGLIFPWVKLGVLLGKQ